MSEIENYQDFVTTLESFKELKSGISGSRIKKLTTYALEHVEEGEKLVTQIIEYSRTCPDSHKLGSLYVIDSIGRAFLDEKNSSEEWSKDSTKSGTYSHSLSLLEKSIQDLITDGLQKSNADHRDKINILLDIWSRSGLFPKSKLDAVRLNGNKDSQTSSNSNVSGSNKAPREISILILENLKTVANLPTVVVPEALTSEDLSEQKDALYKLLKSLYLEKTALEQTFNAAQQASRQLHSSVPAPVATNQNSSIRSSNIGNRHVTTEYGSRRERERERERSPPRRNRSRSPQPRNRRDRDRDHGHFQDNSAINAQNNHHLYPDELNLATNHHFRPKPVSFDSSMPPESVKVLSRTLFIGGVPSHMKEWDLANILRPYAEVQSVILNNARKHAFVKVYSRQEAENVLLNFNKDGSSPLRTRWGVGFGPRDCCDYQHGFSVIPMHRLTDADKKWSVSAQWGGTNGEPLVPGLVFEEPDIVVGDGVSSKAISQKMPTDSNRLGPRSNKNEMSQMSTYANSHNMNPVQQYPEQAYPYPPAGIPNAVPPPQPAQQPEIAYQQQMPPPPMAAYGQQSPLPPPPPTQQQFDPTAHLNSLMSMLNQQQQ